MDNRLKSIADNMDSMLIGLDEPFRFHCDQCGECCIHRSDILLSPYDVYRIAKELNCLPSEVARNYGDVYIGPDSRVPLIRIQPRGSIERCPFMLNHKCSIHAAKPTVCALYPIGRMIGPDPKVPCSEDASPKIQYIFQEPDCGDKSETHTVREWLNGFGIPVDDPIFVCWQNHFLKISMECRDAEKRLSKIKMEALWNLIFNLSYLNYNTEKPFEPQLEENMHLLAAAMDIILGRA